MQALTKELESKGLNPQEIQISELVAKGLSNKEVGNQLFIEESDVKEQLKKIYQKVGVKTRAQLIVHCLPFLSFLQNLSHVKESIDAKINQHLHELNQMENLFGGVFIEIDENRREVLVVGSDNIDLKTLFKIESLEDTVNLEEISLIIKEKLELNQIQVLSKKEFKNNLGLE